MAEEDVPGGMAAEGDAGDGESADEWVAPEVEDAPLPTLTTAAALLPPEEEADDDEIPPTPEEADLQSLPLAERERRKLAAMSPEQKARYDSAQAQIMSHPAVAAFAQEEERRVTAKAEIQAAFVKAWKEKQKK